jgi:hypothetical protein
VAHRVGERAHGVRKLLGGGNAHAVEGCLARAPHLRGCLAHARMDARAHSLSRAHEHTRKRTQARARADAEGADEVPPATRTAEAAERAPGPWPALGSAPTRWPEWYAFLSLAHRWPRGEPHGLLQPPLCLLRPPRPSVLRRCAAVRRAAMRCDALRCAAMRCDALRCAALRCYTLSTSESARMAPAACTCGRTNGRLRLGAGRRRSSNGCAVDKPPRHLRATYAPPTRHVRARKHASRRRLMRQRRPPTLSVVDPRSMSATSTSGTPPSPTPIAASASASRAGTSLAAPLHPTQLSSGGHDARSRRRRAA